MRVLALSLPRLGVQLVRAGRPELLERPVGLLSGEGDAALLTAVSVEATAEGVQPGMSALQARQRCPAIMLEPDNAGACLDSLEHLVSILRARTTTDVAIVSRNAVALDLEGVTQRFADETAAAAGIAALARSWSGLDVRCAVASGVTAAVCAAARARRHPVIVPAEDAESGALPRYAPLSATWQAQRDLPGELAEARLAKMLGAMQPLLDAHPQSFREVRVEVTRSGYRSVIAVRAGEPVHTAAEAAAILRPRTTGQLDGATALRVTLDRPGPSIRVAPWRQHVATVHELSAPAVPVQRRLLLRAS